MRGGALCLLGVLWGAAALAQDEEVLREREQVQDALALERAALDTLEDQTASVLSVIDLIERQAHLTRRRAALLERELTALRRQKALAERQEAVARALMSAQLEALSPRLVAMYKVRRKSRLDALLSAGDFASLIWRLRALSTLLERDLSLVRETHRAIRFQERSRRALERLAASLASRAERLTKERALSVQQQELLTLLLGRIASDAKERARLVRELEQAERRLSRMVDGFAQDADGSAFAALRGSLLWPVAGIIEMGFGKVVNPRFNTVTFQKGLDFRARPGQPVVAVAPGKVVYAGWLKGYGNLMIVDHGSGYHTLMAHLSGFSAQVGAEVEAGAELGTVGETGSLKGPYLYFELRKNGVAIDPAEWLGPGGL